MKEGLSFLQVQEQQHQWLLDRNLDTTIQTQAEKLLEEMPEAQEALAILQSDYTSANEKKFAEELIDVIIVSLGLVAIMGLDSEQLMIDKLAHNSVKYDLQRVLEFQSLGMTPTESMREMKQIYDAQFRV